jgi:ABC-2 type transport system ATP-binding protein
MIAIQNMSFGYSRKKLLYKNLSLTLESGRIYGLLGRNGAGKSTLLKNMIGLLFPLQGTIDVNGFKPKKRWPSFLETIYFITEEVYVPSLTIERYINLFAPFYPKFSREQFTRHLDELDVHSTDKLNTLSFGQQKKFIIAFGLACNTSVLLLDEPTNGLDIPSKKRFRKLIASVMNEERMIFISTHQIRDLDNLIDQVVIVDDGHLLMNEPISSIAEKLLFKTVDTITDDAEVFYSEESLNGVSIVTVNKIGTESKVNLEHLFNAVTENPERIKQIFQPEKSIV